MATRVVYHASPVKGLRYLKPQPTLSNNVLIGDFVFATANRLLALMYLVPKGIVTLMDPDSPIPNIIIGTDAATFRSLDKGGSIYSLAASDFNPTPQVEFLDYEFVATKSVTIVSEEGLNSVLNAMLAAGVTVRFAGEYGIQKILAETDPKKKEELITELVPVTK